MKQNNKKMIKKNKVIHAFTEVIDHEVRTYQIETETMLNIMIETAEEQEIFYAAVTYYG